LYGNSSGGVISVFTQDAPPGQQLDATAEYGSFDTQRYALRELLGQENGVNLVADASQFTTDGYRQHSRTQRDLFNAKTVWQPDAQSQFTLVLNAIDQPLSQDPLGLTAAQLAVNREQAGTGALSYNTRKNVQQQQVGGHYERTVKSHDDLSVLLYGGGRDTRQFQAIPMSTESAPTHPGGVIALQNHYWGADAHLTDHRSVADTPLQLTAGLSYDNLDEGRRGYLNFIGDQLGVQGALRRDETDRVYDLDQYLQLQWDPAARWRLLAGFRHSLVDYASDNHLAADAAPGHSGVSYGTVSPVGGVTFRAGHGLNLYASYGRGFETPTLDELAYRSTDGSLPGLNFALKAARSDNYEIGLKESAAHTRASLAAFFIRTEDELAVQANAAGRSVYQNIPATQRRGAEAEIHSQWPHGLSGQLSYTYLQAVTLQSYMTCLVVPCVPIQISAGHRLPAVPAGSLYAAASWRGSPADAWVTLESIGRAQLYANDLNSQGAGGYWLFDLRAGLSQHHDVWDLSESLQLDNLLNRRYVGSVIVNETNSRFFEPEPGRTAYLMLTVSLR
ncbi:MAG: TonB-dependent receptor family protein, partial [Steroidobacteraceae bacterium]